MKVSIITVTYNSKDTILDALHSIHMQTFNNIEHIIIDGSSVDGTQEIIMSSNYRIDNYISEPDKGIYDALNKGIQKSSGDIVGILHSDDFFADISIIEQVVDCFLEKNPDIIFGDLEYVHSGNLDKVVRTWISGDYSSFKIKWGWMPPHPTIFVKRNVFEIVGFYDFRYKISADYEFILRLFNNEDLSKSYLPLNMVKMRVGGISNNSISGILRKSTEDYTVMKRNKLPFPLAALIYKNMSKIKQFIVKKTGNILGGDFAPRKCN